MDSPNCSHESNNPKRIEYIDVFKGICMFFVILSHETGSSLWNSFYTPFFLTGFFFVSGYFFTSKERPTRIIQKVLNIFTSIVLPYLLYLGFTTVLTSLPTLNLSVITKFFNHLWSGTKIWFISVLILVELSSCILLFFKKLSLVIFPWLILNLIVFFVLPDIQYPWYIRTVFLANVYFSLGIIAKSWNERFIKLIHNKLWGGVSILLYIVLVILDNCFQIQSGTFNGNDFNNYPYFFVESIVGIIGLLFVCTQWTKCNKYIQYIGKSSLLFFLFQSKIHLLTAKVAHYLDIDTGQFLYGIIGASIVILILSPVVYIVNKCIPIMSGKYRIKLKQL